MPNLFDYINDISFNKQNLVTDESSEKEYNPFMVNRGLSQYGDCIMFVNEMNMNPHLPNSLQNDYLINIIRKRKRFSKWAKKKENADLELIMEHFQYNINKASEALSILTPEDIENIRKSKFTGG